MRPITRWLLLALVFTPLSTARAQLSQYNLPVESGILETHVDLQYQYSHRNSAVSLLSLEGQVVLWDFFEVGLNVPFIVHGWQTSGGDVAFGNVMLALKARVFGVGENLGISLFVNTALPTHSGSFTREYVQIHGGGVVSGELFGFQLGSGVQTVWYVVGEGGDDAGMFGLFGYARLPLFGLLAVQAALEYYRSFHYNAGTISAFMFTPSVEVSVDGFHAGIGVRIAATQDARVLSLGRAALIANAGYRF